MKLRVRVWLMSGLVVLAQTAWVQAQSPPTEVPLGSADRVPAKIDEHAGNSPMGYPKAREPIEIRTGHPNGIYALAFSPDGKELATTCGRGDPRVRFWDTRTGQFIRSLEAHAEGVWAVAYTPDGTRLMTSSLSDRDDVSVWDARSHRKLLGLRGHKHGAGLLAVSPDSKRFVSIHNYAAAGDVDVVVWELSGGRILDKSYARTTSLRSAVYLADGRTLMVAEREQVLAWDVGAWAGNGVRDLGDVEVPTRNGQRPRSAPLPMTALGPSGRTLVVEEFGRATRIVEAITGQAVWEITSGIHDGRIALSSDDRTIARPSWGANIELLDGPSKQSLAPLGPTVLPVSKLLFSPDSKRLAAVGSGSKAATLYLWELGEIASRPLPHTKVGPNDVARWCRDLAGEDARAAYQAVWALAGAPDQALARLKAIISERQRITPADLDNWIAGLDDNRFAVREGSMARLRSAGTAALAHMDAALRGNVSAEQRRRLRAIVDAVRDAAVPSDRLFAARARFVLEQIGTSEARKLLDEWASADPGVRPEAEARALVERLTKLRRPDE